MASWNDLADYLRRNYKIAEDTGTLLRLTFALNGNRTQEVLVARGSMPSSDQEWAMIVSFFAEFSAIRDISALLVEASEYVVGGVVQYGSQLAYRHSVPLATLDIDEFLEPFDLTIKTADALEQKFGIGDRF